MRCRTQSRQISPRTGAFLSETNTSTHSLHTLRKTQIISVVYPLRRTRLSDTEEEIASSSPPRSDLQRTGESPQFGETPTLKGKRAVICEDEGITQLQLRRALARAGLMVVGTAGNGQAAVEVVLRERPELVLMDIRMPIMDGLEATRRILAEYRPCIIILTAFADEESQKEGRQLGACGYIIKPVTAESLLPQLEAAYRKFQQGQA